MNFGDVIFFFGVLCGAIGGYVVTRGAIRAWILKRDSMYCAIYRTRKGKSMMIFSARSDAAAIILAPSETLLLFRRDTTVLDYVLVYDEETSRIEDDIHQRQRTVLPLDEMPVYGEVS